MGGFVLPPVLEMLIDQILGVRSRTIRIIGPGVKVIHRAHGENQIYLRLMMKILGVGQDFVGLDR